MKNTIIKLSGIALLTLSLFISSCSNSNKTDNATTGDEVVVDSANGNELAINTETSKVGFTGYGVGKNHPGVFKISSGKVIIDNGKLTGGNFTININSLVLEQPEEMFQTKLKPHLLSADFLDATKYPDAKFEITLIKPYTASGKDTAVVSGANYSISGNLTLKGVTKNITFPANIEVADNSFKALANFNIDRTLWGIRYGNDKSLKDKFISESVNIRLDIVSK